MVGGRIWFVAFAFVVGAIGCGSDRAGSDVPDEMFDSGPSLDAACEPGSVGCEVDECALGLDDCDPAALCTDTPEGFECECNNAFTGNGRTCSGRYTSIASGSGHACAVRVDGTLWCWGSSPYGQVGNDQTEPVVAPVQVGTYDDWLAVTAGENHSCGIRTPGSLWCWGNQGDGRLGTPTMFPADVPARVGEDADWQSVSAGGRHTCAIKADQSLWCWGDNSSGQLGTVPFGYTPSSTPTPITATLIEGDDTWLSVATGLRHTCAVRTDSRLFCWGANENAQVVGVEDETRTYPTEVSPVVITFGWKQVAAGLDHTCATRTVDDGDELFCWGSDAQGQVGGHDDDESHIQRWPRAVDGDDWQFVTAGAASTCATRGNGSRWCWGRNDLGQLGDGLQADRLAPAEVNDGDQWSAIAAGWNFMCGLRGDGFAACWGANFGASGIGDGFGALGDGLARGWIDQLEPFENGNWRLVAAGASIACGIRSSGTLWCWGAPAHGGVGDGAGVWRAAPVQIGEESDWSAVAPSFMTVCGVRGGELYCWGQSNSGVLGAGEEVIAIEPMKIGDGDDWITVDVAAQNACATRGAERTLWCWGELPGIGREDSPRQMAVDTDNVAGWTAVSPADVRVCGIREGGRYCWGAGVEPEGGEPVRMGTSEGWTDIGRACGIRNGRLYCWGAQPTEPVRVGDATDWNEVDASGLCGFRAGDLWCWNSNNPMPVREGEGVDWKPQVSGGGFSVMAIDTAGRRWMRGDTAVVGDGTMWRAEPALIAD